jgi:ABC-type Fe3+/spermidine/putrescine transport system ATPase subunit
VSQKLRLRNVGRDYGTSTAVHDFSLDIMRGEFISLIGPSGCGKTTMLRMIAGFVTPSRGTIEMDGRVISSADGAVPPEKRGMSMIFQSYAIWPNMTVAQNVAFGLEIRRIPAGELKRRVAKILEVVRLSDYADRYPAELSGGQQQRVALARAVVVEPEVLLLDEPLSNLDANLREEMRLEIRRMHNEFKITTIYVTHDQAEAMVTSNRIVVMNKGRVEQVDSPTRLYEQPKTIFAASFVGRTNLLSGRSTGDAVDLGAFKVGARLLGGIGPAGNKVTVSLRPQNVVLREADATAFSIPGGIVVAGTILDGAYLGGSWDYTVDIGAGIALSVLSGAKTEFPRGRKVWAVIDPSRLAVVGET